MKILPKLLCSECTNEAKITTLFFVQLLLQRNLLSRGPA
jgi:hypothetical protein